MKCYYLCLLLVAACKAGLIPSDVDYTNLPNLQTVYHGHGAASFQSVHLDNIDVSKNFADDLQIQDVEHEIPVHEYKDADHIDLADSALYEKFTATDIALKSDALEHHLHDFDEGHDFHL